MVKAPLKASRRKPASTRAAPAADLSPAAAEWHRQLKVDFHVDDPAGLLLLQHAMRAWDRLNEARAVIATQGLVVTCGNGRPVAHPALAIERDAGSAFRSAMRALNFDIAEALPTGRPPNVRS